MITKAQIKRIRLLHQKKHRDEENLFIAEGPKTVGQLLNSRFRVREIFGLKKFKLQTSVFKIEEITEKDLKAISALATPNQVLATFESKETTLNSESLMQELVLALDDIRDPGNLGTIIRIADWFGINHILCSDTCVDVFNPKVIQATMGAIARVNVHYVNLDILLKKFSSVYAAVLDGKNIYSEKLSNKGIILIGNESKGISKPLMNHVTQKLSIPAFLSGQGMPESASDSLNAAVATAIICSEFRRRQYNIMA